MCSCCSHCGMSKASICQCMFVVHFMHVHRTLHGCGDARANRCKPDNSRSAAESAMCARTFEACWQVAGHRVCDVSTPTVSNFVLDCPPCTHPTAPPPQALAACCQAAHHSQPHEHGDLLARTPADALRAVESYPPIRYHRDFAG